MPAIDSGTQIRADGQRYPTGTGPTTPPSPSEGDVRVFSGGEWTYQAGGGGGGVTDHGALTGLGDNDHAGVYAGNGAGVTDLYVGTDPGAVANGAIWFDTP